MAKLLRFPDAMRSREDAALWLAKLDKGLRVDERAALAVWLESAPNREALLELASFWDELDVLAELSDLFPLERRPRFAPRLHRARWVLAGSAAALALAVFVYQTAFAPVEASSSAPARSETFATAIGGRSTQQLSDGSLVTLNTDTEVGVELAAQSRDVYLRRGEAHFNVARDVARPFRVHVGDRILQAVGTAFNVYLRPEGGLELTVTDGTVSIARAAAPDPIGASPQDAPAAAVTNVTKGELAILDRATAAGSGTPEIVELGAADLDIKLAWQRGILVFQGEPLQQLLAEVGRYTTTQFVLEGDALRDVRVGGYFQAGDVDGLLLALRENFEIEFQRIGDDRVVLRPARAAQ